MITLNFCNPAVLAVVALVVIGLIGLGVAAENQSSPELLQFAGAALLVISALTFIGSTIVCILSLL